MDALRAAKRVLGTATLTQTVNGALHEVVACRKRRELLGILVDESRWDWQSTEGAWGGDGDFEFVAEVTARADRVG
jgi:hypothetical protein